MQIDTISSKKRLACHIPNIPRKNECISVASADGKINLIKDNNFYWSYWGREIEQKLKQKVTEERYSFAGQFPKEF